MWEQALDRMLSLNIRTGDLTIVTPGGSKLYFGNGAGDPVVVRLKDKATLRNLVLYPELHLGESYMNATLTIDDDRIQELLALMVQNIGTTSQSWWHQPILMSRHVFRRLMQINVATRSRNNVAHHYDLSSALFDLFLDDDRQYSCGYFLSDHDDLDLAQQQKKQHIARKLLIEPGMRVLDIGCGWGGMALTLARDYKAEVLGITLSEEQLAVATQRAQDAGLADRVRFELRDYRSLEQSFDRIVSVGMFEHVGLPFFDTYFKKVYDLLTPDGVALVHTIGWTAPPKPTNPWIAKYIFPGGYIPTLSEISPAVEKAGLWPADIECWRMHYAYTLRHWFDRFSAKQDQAQSLYDDRFVRMWRYYLAACEQTFRHGRQAVYQFQLSRNIDAIPFTRDYMYQPDDAQSRQSAAE